MSEHLPDLREPPKAIEAEQAVLGGLMIAPESLAQVGDWLRAEDFFVADHQRIFECLTTMASRGEPIDALTMLEWIEGQRIELDRGPGYPIEVANATPSAANVVAYAEIVVEKARLRYAIDRGRSMAAAAWEKGAESARVIAEAVHDLSLAQASRQRGGLQPAKAAAKQLYAEITQRYQAGPGLLGLPTPWHDVNDATKGLRDGVLYVIGARPSMGKSIFGENLASFTALRGDRAAIFSVEMTAAELMSRATASRGRIAHTWVEQPDDKHPDSELYWPRLTQAITALAEAPLLIDEQPSLRIDQIMARARRAHLQAPLRLIVIDHLHDLDVGTGDKVRHEIGRAVQGAKTLAKELRCPVVLLAQLNRGVTSRGDKRPTLADLRESGEIEQKADVVLFLHREDYYSGDTHLKGVVELIPAKGRNIRLGQTIHLANRFDEMRLDDFEGVLPEPPPTRETHGRFGR